MSLKRSRSPKFRLQCIYTSLVKIHQRVHKTESSFSLKGMVTYKIRPSHNSLLCCNKTIYIYKLTRIHCSIVRFKKIRSKSPNLINSFRPLVKVHSLVQKKNIREPSRELLKLIRAHLHVTCTNKQGIF